jgi:hypothetical protein
MGVILCFWGLRGALRCVWHRLRYAYNKGMYFALCIATIFFLWKILMKYVCITKNQDFIEIQDIKVDV